MKIAIDTSYMDRRPAKGMAIWIRGILDGLASAAPEIEITLIHREKIPEDPTYAKYREIVIPRLPLPKFSGFFSEALFFLRTRERFDFYFFPYSRLYPTFWLAPARRIIYAIMDGGPRTSGYVEKAKGKAPWFVRAFFRFVDRFLVFTEFGKRGVVSEYCIDPLRVAVVPCGISNTYIAGALSEDRKAAVADMVGSHDPYLLVVSRFDPHKNIIRTLEAFRRIADAGFRHRLIFVGGRHMPDYSDAVDRRIDELGLQDKIRVMPVLADEDLRDLYRAADACLFLSLYEGFGLPAVEAARCMTPLVISDIDALKEVTGGHAQVVDPYDVDDIARGIRSIIEDRAKANELAQKAFEYAGRYTWRSAGAKLASILAEPHAEDGTNR